MSEIGLQRKAASFPLNNHLQLESVLRGNALVKRHRQVNIRVALRSQSGHQPSSQHVCNSSLRPLTASLAMVSCVCGHSGELMPPAVLSATAHLSRTTVLVAT